MTYLAESYAIHLSECLNHPINMRTGELANLFDRCTTKELQDYYPILINSIFTSPGWGLRTTAREFNIIDFDSLYNFFVPLGPMFRLCYRLLNEPIKFDIPIEHFPSKMIQMLHSGRYSIFYSDILNIDPYRRQVTSLSLNAFDYFFMHFVLHGMLPLHKTHPGALAVQTDNLRTVYFYLTADYLCSFLPSDPDATVLPNNMFCSVKSVTTLPIQPIQPSRSPKYLKLSALSNTLTSQSPNIRAVEPSRSSCWRTETVLHSFIDNWLQYDVDENSSLPGSEFIQVVRILVKQLHAFGNTADMDLNHSMAALRSLAQPMMNAHMYTFLQCIVQRWPHDSSFSVVLELWLSYIQPWRYIFNRPIGSDCPQYVQIPRKFDQFISDNIVCYTQIYITLLPRFERLDFTSLKNVALIYRLVKVFGQSNLAELLKTCEYNLFISKKSSAIKTSHHGLSGHSQHHSLSSSGLLNTFNSFNTSESSHQHHSSVEQSDWHLSTASHSSPSRSESLFHNRSDGCLHEDTYIHMFGPVIYAKISIILRKTLIAREEAIVLLKNLEAESRKRNKGVSGYIRWFVQDPEETEYSLQINDLRRIPDILDVVAQGMGQIFNIDVPDSATIANGWEQRSWEHTPPSLLNQSSVLNNTFNSSICPSPVIMRKRIRELEYTGDPLLIPIQSNEFTFLVRHLYRFSAYLNNKYSDVFQYFWHRSDLFGCITHRILEPPINVMTFDKSNGYSQLIEEPRGARINLRRFASYRSFIAIAISIIFGQLVFGTPVFGVFLLLVFNFVSIFLLSVFDLVSNIV